MGLGDYFREKIFQTSDEESPGADLSDPQALGLLTSRSVTSVQLPTSDGGHIGAWLMAPDPGGDHTDHTLAQAVLCVHGVKGNRSRSYRCELYEFLLDKGFQVTFDITMILENPHLNYRFLHLTTEALETAQRFH